MVRGMLVAFLCPVELVLYRAEESAGNRPRLRSIPEPAPVESLPCSQGYPSRGLCPAGAPLLAWTHGTVVIPEQVFWEQMQPLKVEMSLELRWQLFRSLLLWSWGLPCTPQSTTVIPLECCSGLSLKGVQLRLLMQAALARGAEPSSCSVLPSGSPQGCSWWVVSCLAEPLTCPVRGCSTRAGGRRSFLPITGTQPGPLGGLGPTVCARPGNTDIFFPSPTSFGLRVMHRPRSCQSDVPARCQLGGGTGFFQPGQCLGG